MMKKLLLDTQGAGAILVALLMGVLSLMAMQYLTSQSIITQKASEQSYVYEGKKYLLHMLSELVGELTAIQNSRFAVNQALRDCMLGTAGACDERIRYDLIIFPPAPIIPFAGIWGDPPAALSPVIGGNPATGGTSGVSVFYTSAGERCPTSTTEMSIGCPLQAMAQFRPLCGGTQDIPAWSVAGGAACTNPARGFIFYTGVRSYYHGRIVFSGTDENEIQVSSNQLFL